MRWFVGMLPAVVGLLASGCFGPSGALAGTGPTVGVSDPLWFDTGVSRDETLDEGEYWLVYVQGAEEHEHKSGAGDDRNVECPATEWLYRLDRTNHTLSYNPKMAKVPGKDSVDIVVVVDFFGVGFGSKSIATGCPTDYRLSVFEQSGETKVALQNFGKATVKIFPQGHLGVIGPEPNMTFVLPLGKGLGYEYTKVASTDASEYWVSGRWHVQNMGAWSKDGLTAGS